MYYLEKIVKKLNNVDNFYRRFNLYIYYLVEINVFIQNWEVSFGNKYIEG